MYLKQSIISYNTRLDDGTQAVFEQATGRL